MGAGGTPQRRQFVGGVALAGLATPRPGEAAAPSPIPEAELEAFLEELDRDLARMSRHRAPGPLRRSLEQRGLRPGLFGDSFATLQLASEWHASSEAVQAHSGFQQRLVDRAARLGADLCALAEVLRGLPATEREQSRRVLRRPNRSLRLLDESYFDKAGPMMKRRRGHVRRNLDFVGKLHGGGVDRDGLGALLAEVDRACAEAGTTCQDVARVDATRMGTVDMHQLVRAVQADTGTVPPERAVSEEEGTSERAMKAARVGLTLLGLTLGAFVVGLALLFSDAVLAGAVLTMFVAPVLLLAALVVLVVALAFHLADTSTDDETADARAYRARTWPLLADLGPVPA